MLSAKRFQFMFTPAFAAGAVVFCVSLLIQAILLTDYYLHSPFYSGLICDARVYDKWASTILDGNWIGDEIFHQAPLYPYFIALLWLTVGKSHLVIYASQALMTALACTMVFMIGRHYFRIGAGLAAGLLCAFYGTINFYALKVLPDTLGMFLHLWLAWLLINAASRRRWLMAGCVCGLLIIARPHVLLLLPMLLIWALFLRENTAITIKSVATGLTQYACFILPVVCLVGLTALRNYTIEPDLVLVSANGGENFYMGNNAKADGIYCRIEGISPDIKLQKENVQRVAEEKTGTPLTRAAVSAYWMGRGMEFIRNNFADYLRLEALKLKRIFSGTEYTNMYFTWLEQPEFTKTLAIPSVNFYHILPLIVIGAGLLIRQWRKYALLLSMIMLSILNMLIFYVDERYRLPLIPFLIILGVGGVYRLLETIRAGSIPFQSKVGLIALAAAAAGGTAYMYRTEPRRLEVAPQLYCNLGSVYYEQGEYRKALDTFYRSSRMAVNNWESAMGISKASFALGNREIAAQLYQTSFPNLDKELQSIYLHDKDLDALRAYIAKQTQTPPP